MCLVLGNDTGRALTRSGRKKKALTPQRLCSFYSKLSSSAHSKHYAKFGALKFTPGYAHLLQNSIGDNIFQIMNTVIAMTKIHEIGFAQLIVLPIPYAFGTRKFESLFIKIKKCPMCFSVFFDVFISPLPSPDGRLRAGRYLLPDDVMNDGGEKIATPLVSAFKNSIPLMPYLKYKKHPQCSDYGIGMHQIAYQFCTFN